MEQEKNSEIENNASNPKIARLRIAPLIVCLPITAVLIILITILCYKRSDLRYSAYSDIASKWGGSQLLEAPFIIEKSGMKTLMPDTLDANTELLPEIRYRSIYEFIVYTANVGINAKFPQPSKHLSGKFGETYLAFRLTHSKDVNDIRASINNTPISFAYDENLRMFLARLKPADMEKDIDVKLELSIRGSETFYMLPVAKTNSINMSSSWSAPSFSGEYLPTSRQIDKGGFSATWKINSFSAIIRTLKEEARPEECKGAGTCLIMPINVYRQTERALSYAFLFIAIFLVSIISTEYLTREKLDLIQYILASATPVVFYLMTLAISEHTGFGLGFAVSALLCSALIAFYIGAAIGKMKVGVVTFMFNLAAYGVMFVLLYLENMSLLVGSIVVFAILAILMSMTVHANKVCMDGGQAKEAGQTAE